MGKKDIWYTVFLPNGLNTIPVNLGPPVNTAGDDITPYYHQASGTLYFSSDGHNGLGGFDIYKSKGFKNTWNEPVNLGAPINSIYDEMYYTVNENDTNGFFTSNRPGSFYNEKDTCCKYDIYEYRISYKKIPPKLIAKKDNVKPEILVTEPVKNQLIHRDATIKEIPNTKIQKPITSNEQLIKNIEQDTTTYEKPITNKEQQITKNEQLTTNNELPTKNTELRTTNNELRTPLILYFDNDYPDPGTDKIYTDYNYISLLKDYATRRNEYIKQYSGTQHSSVQPRASSLQKEINNFFDDKVIRAEDYLKEFSEQLMASLKKGCKITLEIGGYCSPLYTSPYNYNLSQRRISSFIVYICHYNNGEFIKYFHPSSDNSGALSFIFKPEGKEKRLRM